MWVTRFQNLFRPFKDLPSPVSSNSAGSSEMSRDEILLRTNVAVLVTSQHSRKNYKIAHVVNTVRVVFFYVQT